MPKYVHYTELTPCDPKERLGVEWNCYLREVGRLIAEGHQGKYVLIKGDEVIGVWETEEEAHNEGRRRFPLQDRFVHHIMTWERVYVQRISYV